jgi:hypothetical protein
VALDGAGDLFIADQNNTRVVKVPAGGGAAIAIDPTLNGVSSEPQGVTVDGAGDLFIADRGNNRVVELPAGGGAAIAIDPTVNGTGLNVPTDVAVDGAGDLFIADVGNNRMVEVPAGGGAATVLSPMVNGTALSYPSRVTLDGAGNLFIGDHYNSRVVEIQRPQPPTVSFPTATNDGSIDSDGTQTVQVSNSGNEPLIFSALSYPADFSATSDADACSGSTSLSAGEECDLPIRFSPVSPSTGPLSESVTLTTNAPASPQSVTVTGTAIDGPSFITANAGATPQSATVSTAFANPLAVTVKESGGNPVSGVSVTFTAPAAGASGTFSNSTGTITVTTNASGVGSASFTANATVGGYSVAASASGLTTVSFSLTNTPSLAITSANSTTFTVGVPGSFQVTANATSLTFTATGLPMGLTISSAGSISGTPVSSVGSPYSAVITVIDGFGNIATQKLTLTVDQVPAITSANSTAFTVNAAGSFTVTTNGNPKASLSESGALPSGVTFADNGNGTATLAGTPASAGGSYPITITANNGVSPNATQSFTLTVMAMPHYIVTSLVDDASGVAGNCSDQNLNGATPDNNCSLRDAIAAAAAIPQTTLSPVTAALMPTITFASTLCTAYTGSTCTASITPAVGNAGTYSVTTGGTLTVSANMNITGPTTGSWAKLTNLVTVAGGGSSNRFSVFTVSSGVTGAAINNLTITNGYSGVDGGGIHNGGALTVSNSTVSGNTSTNSGGGIFNNGTLTVSNSTVSGNSSHDGGGICNEDTLTVTNSTVSGNTSTNFGGGIFNEGALTVSNSTFSGNSSTNINGGGIHNNAGTLTVSNSTFSGNSAADYGGGINNSAGTLILANTIAAGNTAISAPDLYGNATDHGYNLIGNGTGSTGLANGINSTQIGTSASPLNPQLAQLANYGGPTKTMLPQPGSPAICATSPSTASGTDQRGDPRTTTYGTTSCQDSGAVQTNYSIAFLQQPLTVVQNAAMLPAPTIQLDESGVAFADGTDTIAIPLSLTTGSGTVSGGSVSTSATTGVATYSALSISLPGTSDVLTANLTLNSAITPATAIAVASNPFNVNSAVTQLAFVASPPATLTAGGNAGSVTVDEENFGGTLVTTASDTVTLTVTGPGSYSNIYTVIAVNGVATFNLSSGALTAAGSYSYVASIAGNSAVTAANAAETVSKAAATVTLDSLSQTYTGSALSATATTTPASLTVTFTYNGSAAAPTTAGTYTVVGTVSDPNYQGSATGTLIIAKATPTVTWATPAAITYGTALNATQLDASSPVAGTFAYNPAAGTVLAAGSQELSVTFTPADATDYTTATASVTLTVNVQTQTISLASSTLAYASGVPFGVAPLTLSATSTSGLSVTFTLLSGPATLSGNSLTVNGAGTVAIAANQAGNANYAPAPQVVENITVNKALPTASIASSADPVLLQNAITLSATIASGAGTPTGTVTFLDGSTPLGTGTLSGGVVTLTTSSLATGAHSVTAAYGGDANFLASTSSPLTQLVEDFNFNISSTSNNSSSSITVMPGGTAVFTFTVSPIDGSTFPAAVTLTLSGLPAGATYSFSPATIAAGAGATVVTLTIDIPQTEAGAKPLTLHPGAQLAVNRNGGSSGGQAGGVAGRLAPFSLALLLPFAGRLRRTGKRLGRMMCALLLLAAVMAAVAGMSGCGSTSGFFGQQQQSYTVTITATSGALSHSTTVTLTVE